MQLIGVNGPVIMVAVLAVGRGQHQILRE